MAYEEVFQFLVRLGLVDVILPFLLVFTITYATLRRTEFLKDNRINAMVAFVMGFFAVMAVNILNIINIAIAYFVLLLIVALMLALLFGLIGAQVGNKNKILTGIIAGVAVIFLFLALVQAEIIEQDKFWIFLIIMLILGAIIYAIQHHYKGKSAPAKKSEPKRASAEGEQELEPPTPR
jgi:uncharacterized membrane protein